MSSIQWDESVCQFNGREVNTFTWDGRIYFYSTDIASILEYKNVNFALTMNIRNEDRLNRHLLAFGHSMEMGLDNYQRVRGSLKGNYISANGVISLLNNSDIKDPEPFKKWLKTSFPTEFKMLVVREEAPKPVPPKVIKKKPPKKAEPKAIPAKAIEKKSPTGPEPTIVPYESYLTNYSPSEKKQIFYIASTAIYAKENRFKYGGIANKKDLNSRLQKYNTGRPEFDTYYYCKVIDCYNYRMIEERLHCICAQFKDKPGSRKEMVVIPYELLVNLVTTICANIDHEMQLVDALVKK